MKRIVYLALFIGFALTNTSCNSDKKAQVINTFVKTYFPDTEVIANIKDGLDCDVTLSDYTSASSNGMRWTADTRPFPRRCPLHWFLPKSAIM